MSLKSDGRKFLPYVLGLLRKRIGELNLSIEEGQREVEGMHEYYWENYTEMDQYGYEDYDNQQALLHQIRANEDQLLLRRRFRKLLDSPFFGRVDFCYRGEEEPEIFYIGIGNFSGKTGGTPLIYDWRAPVSGLFYDYDKGPASYTAPAGEMTGEVVSKWQYKIRRGQMIYDFESDIKIDDEILGAELGGPGSVRLKNIIRTIQREQNAVIRNTKDRILVIQGAAGSGKTSIALHRIAYLLYHDRQNLQSSNILILSPNSVFSDYISQILPELGEENIQEMSFDLFAYHQLKETAGDCEDRYDEIERLLARPGERGLYRIKQSREFVNRMEGFLLRLEDELMDFREIRYRDVVYTEKRLLDLFYIRFPDVPLLSRMEDVEECFADEVETLYGRNLDEEERGRLFEEFQKMYAVTDLYVLYNRFLKEEGYPPLPDAAVEKRKIPYEDVYPLLYMKYRLRRQKSRQGIKHLVVDEMQDYSYLQYQIIQMIFPCRMTILGDKAQTMDGEQQDVLEYLPGILGRDIHMVVMNKSYRNTVEIAEYANALAGLTGMELFERHGKPVEEQNFDDMEQALDQILTLAEKEEGIHETRALILRSEAEALAAYRYLADKPGSPGGKLSYLDRNSAVFSRGLTVTTFYLAKGLEFDQVFSLFPAEDVSPLAQRGRYIAATRALHELHVYEYGRPDGRPGKSWPGK